MLLVIYTFSIYNHIFKVPFVCTSVENNGFIWLLCSITEDLVFRDVYGSSEDFEDISAGKNMRSSRHRIRRPVPEGCSTSSKSSSKSEDFSTSSGTREKIVSGSQEESPLNTRSDIVEIDHYLSISFFFQGY